MTRLDGKVVLITGSSSGIGAACALRMAQEGARIAGLDVQELTDGDWSAAVSLVGDAPFAKVDVRDGAAVRTTVADVERALGRIDVLVNCAGVAGGGAVHMIEEDEWDRVMDVNLRGTYLSCRAVIPGMLERGVGNIVNLPLAAFSGSAEFRRAVERTLLPALGAFRPELVLVSAGFDAHLKDPLAQLRLLEADFAWATEKLREAAEKHCGGRLVSTLEGGYDLDALGRSTAVHVKGLM